MPTTTPAGRVSSALTPLSILLATAGLVALYVGVTSSFLLSAGSRQVWGSAAAGIVGLQQQQQDRFESQLRLLTERRARFLASLPDLADIGRAMAAGGRDPVESRNLAQWREHLTKIGVAYTENFPDLVQIRLIGVADGGRELVRVNRDAGGEITVAAQADLQQQGDQPYFHKALRLPEGGVYVSPIDLSVENDRIELPPRPILLAATAVRNAKGEVFGVVVIQVLAQTLLGPFTGSNLQGVTMWVTDGAGHYLAHPQPGKAFAHLLDAPGATWQQEFTAAPESETVALITDLRAGTSRATLRAPDGTDWLMFTTTLRAPEADGTGGTLLHSGIPLTVLAARAWSSVRGPLMLVCATGVVAIGLLVFILLRWRGTPLELTVHAENATLGRALQTFGLKALLTTAGRKLAWRVIPAALLPVVWWGLITVVLGQPMVNPFILMLLPVLLASWWGGRYAGLAATGLAMVGAWDLTMDSPFADWGTLEPDTLVNSLMLLVIGLLVTFVQEATRRRGVQLLAAQHEARESEQRLVTQAPVALAMFDTEMRYLAASAHWKTSYGLAADSDLTGRGQHEVLPERFEQRKAVYERVLAGETLAEHEGSFRRADGSVYWVNWEAKPWRTPDGAIGGLIVWREDVTQAVKERKASEEALKSRLVERTELLEQIEERIKQQERAQLIIADRNVQLDTIFRLSPDGLVLFGDDLRVKFANPAFVQLTGLQIDEIVGLRQCELERQLRQHVASADTWPGLSSYFTQAPNGQHRLELALPQHAVLSCVGVSVDAHSVKQLLYLRDVTYESEVSRMKSDFLSHAAHELRTPLTSISGFSELLIHEPCDEATRADYLVTIQESAARLVEIINELLDLARIEARQGKDFDIVSVAIRPLVGDVLANLRIDPVRWPVSVVDQTALVNVRADSGKLRQCIANVLSNAIKYSPAGGPIEIRYTSRATDGTPFLGLTICDHGIGLTPYQIKRVGERFYRADTSGKTPGSGLGMAIVKEIVELLGGSVSITSTHGEGTSVSLWLRAAHDASTHSPQLGALSPV